ncbi:hypothetical protein C8J57DRAFT_1737531 [Mycena rebaudengoi]|nr:hypothetical protein C8J57DRAFT_1737531 [Mycena rebaudengoi]
MSLWRPGVYDHPTQSDDDFIDDSDASADYSDSSLDEDSDGRVSDDEGCVVSTVDFRSTDSSLDQDSEGGDKGCVISTVHSRAIAEEESPGGGDSQVVLTEGFFPGSSESIEERIGRSRNKRKLLRSHSPISTEESDEAEFTSESNLSSSESSGQSEDAEFSHGSSFSDHEDQGLRLTRPTGKTGKESMNTVAARLGGSQEHKRFYRQPTTHVWAHDQDSASDSFPVQIPFDVLPRKRRRMNSDGDNSPGLGN